MNSFSSKILVAVIILQNYNLYTQTVDAQPEVLQIKNDEKYYSHYAMKVRTKLKLLLNFCLTLKALKYDIGNLKVILEILICYTYYKQILKVNQECVHFSLYKHIKKIVLPQKLRQH